jgi:uncharacterized phage-associated protein
MSYSAAAVANKFLELAKPENKGLTNMHLQKLVYIAHGYSLALLGEPLIYNNVHAFEWGPVIPKLYKALSKYGDKVVVEPLKTAEPPPPNDSPEMKVIERVWKNYKGLSGIELSAITHKEDTPWSEIWKTDRFGVIPNELIASHYATLIHEQAGR